MKKKLLVSIVASAAILMANPIANQADAASNTTYTKVYTYKSSNLSAEQINALFEKYFKNIHVQQQPVEQQQVTTPVTQPTQQPVQQQPAQKEDTSNEQAGYQLNQFEQQVVDLTNQERAKNGLSALKVDTALSKVAREKSLDMQRNNYFSHTSPTYGSPFDMMKKFAITYRAAGENIAKGQRTPEEVVNAWMNSAGHRKNILSANFTHIGVGYVSSGNYWTQQFIGK
ncbi:CAP domain-containing protein [Metabacillus litoralis]|uniref:CAP domain-containing protein n=1 Tax=Metabacillus litoralis TaxID=152268 RepID=UPI001CFC945E|nr:CAP domain-containing protein [Metabacillus litoralis]